MKFLCTFALLLTVFAACQANSATWGRRNNTDFLIYNQRETRAPIKNNYWNINVNYPSSGSFGPYNITMISVIDNFRNKSGATPSLWSGGPKYRYAQINLRSMVGKGVDSTIQIYGKY